MVEFMLIPVYYKKEIKLNKKALEYCKKFKKIALFAAVQFIKLDKVEKQLSELNIKITKSHGKRTSGEYQLLGCDCFEDSFNPKITDAILYIGDGLFHPKALLLAKKQEIGMYDPIANNFKLLTEKDLEKQHKKYKANIVKYIASKKIGILVSTKTGQQYLKNALKLKEKSDKESYIFIGDTLDYNEMENFPFIEAWVNTACPRIGTDDIVHIQKPLININEAFNPIKALENAK